MSFTDLAIKHNKHKVGENVLFLKHSIATFEQYKWVINECVNKLDSEFGVKTEVRYNFPTTRDGRSLGMCFVHLSNPKAYYAILGYNFDGTERVEREIITHDEDELPEPQLDANGNFVISTGSWADDCDSVDERIEKLPPLIKIPEFTLTEDQVARLQTYRDDDDPETGTDSISITPIDPPPVDSSRVVNVLSSWWAPMDLSVAEVKQAFKYLCKDTTTVHDFSTGPDTYPYVTISDVQTTVKEKDGSEVTKTNRTFYVEFPQNDVAVHEAYLMNRRVTLGKKTLVFEHPFKSDRSTRYIPDDGFVQATNRRSPPSNGRYGNRVPSPKTNGYQGRVSSPKQNGRGGYGRAPLKNSQSYSPATLSPNPSRSSTPSPQPHY